VKTLRTLKEDRRKLNAEVAAYMFSHPAEPQWSVAQRFGMTESTVSRIGSKAGLAPRKPGRKPKVQVQQ
jgi:DNA-binding transcriptional regulator LsrR (DeoR family)